MRADNRAARRRLSKGQALTEMLVVSIALVPLAVLTVLLGKYQSLGSATIAASRTAAFECAARPASCRGDDVSALLSQAIGPVHFAHPGRNPLWHDRAGRPLLERVEDVRVGLQPLRFDAGLATAAGRSGQGAVFDRLGGPARFGLGIDEGLVRAEVSTSIAPAFSGNRLFARLDPIAVTMRARTAILTDTWQASGPREGPASVESIVGEGARLDPVREFRLEAGYRLTRWSIDLMGVIGLEPTASDFRHRYADPEALPADRVGTP